MSRISQTLLGVTTRTVDFNLMIVGTVVIGSRVELLDLTLYSDAIALKIPYDFFFRQAL